MEQIDAANRLVIDYRKNKNRVHLSQAGAACVHQKTKFFVVGTNVLDILLNKLV